jgi:hypothetical protein
MFLMFTFNGVRFSFAQSPMQCKTKDESFGLHHVVPPKKNDSTSAVLSAVVEAVEWKHVTELVSDGSKRSGQRVVIYPPELEKLGTVIATKNAGADSEEGHEIACERILSASNSFEHPPKFFPSDHEDFKGLADTPKVMEWMNLSSQIATAGRRQAAEDGRYACNSDSDSDTEQHGEVIYDGYVGIKTDSNGNPIGCEHGISNEQTEAQRRERQWEANRPKTGVSGKDSDSGEVPKGKSSENERTKSTKAPANRSESSHSMSTRSKSKNTQQEREAGGARVTTGSGQKDTRAAKSRPSKT